MRTGPYTTRVVGTWITAQIYVSLKRAYAKRPWDQVTAVLGLSARAVQSYEQAAADGIQVFETWLPLWPGSRHLGKI